MGTQKNRLHETVLLSTQNTCLNWWIRKKSQFYSFFCVLNWPYESIRCQSNLFTFNYCKLQNKSVISVWSLFCYFFQWSVGFTQCFWESETPKIGPRNQKLMPASYGLKFEKDLASFNLLHLWNIMYLKILLKMEHLQMLQFPLYFSNSRLISFNFLEFFCDVM